MGYDYMKAWRFRTKERALSAFGNVCGVCGYNKCIRALEFHHLDRDDKEFNISGSKVNNWGTIVSELRKCILVCSNCHREIHNGVTVIPNNVVRFNEDFADYMTESVIQYNNCPSCGGLKRETQQYCSMICFNKSTEKVDWDKYDLKQYILDGRTLLDISKEIGVSDNAVRKRLKKLGLPFKRKDIEIYRALV